MKFKKSTVLALGLLVTAMFSIGATIPYLPEQETRLEAIETKATLSGDATVTSAGVMTIAAGVIESSNMAASTIVEADIDEYNGASSLHLKRVARVAWDVTGSPTYGDSTYESGVNGLGVYLPAKSMITQSYMYVVTVPQESGNNANDATLAFQCEDSANIMAATDVKNRPAGTIWDGTQTGASSVMVAAIADGCQISSVVADDSYSSGKIVLFVEYVVVE
jgi:hypothetical protein